MDDSMIGKFITEQSMDEPMELGMKPMPKLHRFVDHDKPIHYLKVLEAGDEGIVYHVTIEGREYALKLVSYYSILAFQEPPLIAYDCDSFYHGNGSSSILSSIQSSKFTHLLFANECRAFARLQSIGENGTWAVKCHGWMKLSDAQQRPIAKRYGIIEQGRWAIIKDYLPNPVQLSDCQEIARKKDIFRRALICVGDVQPRNFRGSFLVDLGTCKTYPYIKRFWSDREFNRVWENYDKNVMNWEVHEQTGEVVFGGTNAQRRKHQQQDALMRKAKFDPKLGYDVLPGGWDKD